MSNYNKYQKLKKQYSYDGVHWSDVEPAEYKLGEVIEENSTDCGAIEPQYRWYNADPSTDYICNGYNKFYKQYYQVSYDGGTTWENVQPIETQIGEIVEPNSTDCDYGISWEVVPDEYICKLLEGGGSGGSGGDTPQITYGNWVAKSSDVLQVNKGFTINSLGTGDDGLYHFTVEGAGTRLTFYSNVIYSHYIDLTNVTYLNSMFFNNYDYIGGNFTGWNTSKVEDMNSMFSGCHSLKKLDLSSFNTSSLEDMSAMFDRCNSLETLDLSSFNTSNVFTMRGMFNECTSLKTLNLSSFNTSKLRNMSHMFQDCHSLETLNLSSFNTSNVEDMSFMFYGCSSLKELNISGWDLTIAYNKNHVNDMFTECASLQKIYAYGCNETTIGIINNALSKAGLTDKVTIITQ